MSSVSDSVYGKKHSSLTVVVIGVETNKGNQSTVKFRYVSSLLKKGSTGEMGLCKFRKQFFHIKGPKVPGK